MQTHVLHPTCIWCSAHRSQGTQPSHAKVLEQPYSSTGKPPSPLSEGSSFGEDVKMSLRSPEASWGQLQVPMAHAISAKESEPKLRKH